MGTPRLTPLIFLLVLLAACSDPAAPGDGWAREPGRLMPELSSIQVLQMPTQARAGTAFEITVTTVGSSSCTRPDGATVSVSGLVADVTPWDRIAPEGTACTDDLHPFPRAATVRFDTPGSALIRLHGSGGLVYEASLTVVP
ncbi:MAG: hypothetical protein AMXMBFR53_07820 [Gemmatimonadota bacterium]